MDSRSGSRYRDLHTSTHRSIYEAIQQHESSTLNDENDPDSPTAVDERNLAQPFHDQDLDRLLAEEVEDSQSIAAVPHQETSAQAEDVHSTPGLKLPPPPSATEDELDIPAALLSEDKPVSSEQPRSSLVQGSLPSPVPGPGGRPRVKWAQRRRSFGRGSAPVGQRKDMDQSLAGPLITDPEEKAMWIWANVDNLDSFLGEVYYYFRGKGIWSILLARLIQQLTLAFVISFGTFLGACIDYRKLPGSHHLAEVMIPKCTTRLSGITNLVLWGMTFFWIYECVRICFSARRLWNMHSFFTHLLKITEDELQTITWQAIVSRLMDLRDSNARTALNVTPQSRRFLGGVSKQRMDAHDIANRLMRKENYLIALFNKDILDLTLPVPILRNRPLLSRNLEWNISLCVFDYVFNEQGQVSQLFLKDSHRRELIEGLRRRFIIAGFFNIISAPFHVTFSLLLYFLRYFTEFQKEPARIGSRSYTPFAEWKFREFNELYHFFERRLYMSRPFASEYLDQFPKDRTTQVARFVAFIAGALAAVLAIATLLDPELFLGFEITKDRTALFYLSLFGSVWAVARGMVPEDEAVFDPEHAINNVAEFTHYKPSHWNGRLHTEDVRREFSALYQMKIVIFLEEIMSIVFTPFLLWFSLPKCSERLVDFFREFTIHVDGLGYVCSFALFEFSKGAPRLQGSQATDPSPATNDRDALREDYYATRDGKMLSSYYSFMDSYANNGRPAPAALRDRASRGPPHRSVTREHEPRHNARHRDAASSLRARRPLRASTLQTASPSPSILLDARHQPAKPHVPRAERGPVQSILLPEARPLARHHELDEDDEVDAPVSSSALIEADSTLGDSWRTTVAAGGGGGAAPNRAPDASTSMPEGPGGDAGVLGLLYEFQRAQTEGRGAPVTKM